MAQDSIVRLRLESQEYDAKLKRATDGLRVYAKECRNAGGTLEYVDEGVMDFIRALGRMDTVARDGKAQLREYTQALNDLTLMYSRMSDAEKNSDTGKALAASIDQLKGKIDTVKDSTDVVTNSISQLAGAARLSAAAFQGLQGAAKMLGIDMGDDVQIIANLQSAMGVVNSLTTIQTALQKESAVMQSVQALQTKAAAASQALLAQNTGLATVAQKAFNLVAKANPYAVLVTAIGAVVGAIALFTNSTSKAKKEQEEFNKMAIDFNKRVSDIVGEQISKFGLLQQAYNSYLQQGKSVKQFVNDYSDALKSCNIDITNLRGVENTFTNGAESFRKSCEKRATALAAMALRAEEAKRSINRIMQIQDNLDENGNNLWKKPRAASELSASEMLALRGGYSWKEVSNMTAKQLNEAWQKHIRSDKDNWDPLSVAEQRQVVKMRKDVLFREETERHRKANQAISSASGYTPGDDNDPLKNKPRKPTGGSGGGRGDAAPYEPQTQVLLFGVDNIPWWQKKNALPEMSVQGSMGMIDVNPDIQMQSPSWVQRGQKNPELTRIADTMDESAKLFSDINGGISSIVTGVETLGIEMPEGMKKMLSMVQGVTAILSGISALMLIFNAQQTTNTLTNIATAVGAIAMHRGGVVRAATGTVVPGNYGFDAVPALLTSGETVLTRAQAGNIASQLQQGSRSVGTPQARVSGEDIYIALTNYMQRRGYGEVVMSH